MWILFWSITTYYGVNTGSQEFSKKPTCDAAANYFAQHKSATNLQVRAWCVKK